MAPTGRDSMTDIPNETIELATIAWYEATPGVSWEDAGHYERVAMLSRSKLILEAALPHLRVQEAGVVDLAGALRETVDAARARRLGSAGQAAPHPRPVVDREALRSRLWDSLAGSGLRDVFRDELAEAQADAILALLPTEEGKGS